MTEFKLVRREQPCCKEFKEKVKEAIEKWTQEPILKE